MDTLADFSSLLDCENDQPSWNFPHAFHQNLPEHHFDDDGIPFITKFASKKAQYILELARSLKITERMFVNDDESAMDVEHMDDMEIEEDDDDDGVEDGSAASDYCLHAFCRKCLRLQSQFSGLEHLKHSGLSRVQLCEIVLHILKLLTATITITDDRKVTIHYETVGYIYSDQHPKQEFPKEPSAQALEESLKQPFALPSPAREALLSMATYILSNKGPLRSASNAAIFVNKSDDEGDKAQPQAPRFLLILHWRALLRMLLRTAPYLDEHKTGNPPLTSNTRQNTITKRTVQMIRDARHFFDQGLVLHSPTCHDNTAREVWDMVEKDVLFHGHTHACYRSLILLYLFQPSRCTSQFYLDLFPKWFDAWSNIDRCTEMDFLWLTLFCRGRKHLPSDYDWGPIRRKLLTHCQYWLQIPIGGATMDKSFPRAGPPRSRSCPARLKVFCGSSSGYEEGIDFVAKVSKLLVMGLGKGTVGDDDGVSEGTRDVLRFMSFATPYFNPSNLGSWTFTLGAFLHYFSYEICCRVGAAGSMKLLKAKRPQLVEALYQVEPPLEKIDIPPHEIVMLLDSLLPLCQQALYSKNGHVGRAGEAAMMYLSQIDPARVTPAFIDFATRALDIAAVNLAHQAPAALSALTRLLQPALRSNPKILLVRLPDILRLTLAGIDSNDQNKTIRTLILYRSLASWIPVGGSAQNWKRIEEGPRGSQGEGGIIQMGEGLMENLYAPTKTPEYIDAVANLPEQSLLKQGVDVEELDLDLLTEEACSALGDWALDFLERVYALLRATGEREKRGKTASGVANRHTSADVQQARNFSRVLKECLMQTFTSMDDDIHRLAVKSVVRFLSEETLPEAAKDASYLCQAAGAVRINDGKLQSPGLDVMLPILLDDLGHHSNKTVVYRLRCLSGSVRSCGSTLNNHKAEVTKAIEFALASTDKHVYKTGCKLLRHTLATLCESYPLAADLCPRAMPEADGSLILGKSSTLHRDNVKWHTPSGESVNFAWNLLEAQVFKRLKNLALDGDSMDSKGVSDLAKFDIVELRRCIKVIRYALRGGASFMLDLDTGADIISTKEAPESESQEKDIELFPYEKSVHKLLQTASAETYESILQMRGQLCSFVIMLSSLIASESFKNKSSNNSAESGSEPVGSESASTKYADIISSDTKVCKETSDVALLLLTRRGACFRSQEGKTIWKAQKQLATDFSLLAQADHLAESLQRSQLYGSSSTVFFKDGEDGGKTLPRRLLVTRVQLFHDSLQRTASFEIPKRLRRLSKIRKGTKKTLFSSEKTMENFNHLLQNFDSPASSNNLDAYEGIFDGLFSLCCHPNTQVRASAIGVVDYAITRYGWLVQARVPRMIAAVNLEDDKMHGKFGIPSSFLMKDHVDGQGKRKRLAEVMKGICSLLAVPRAAKQFLGHEHMRLQFVKTICGTDELISMMPPDEMQKMVHYLQSVFSPFRLKYYCMPRPTKRDQAVHEESIEYVLGLLAEKKAASDADEGDAKAVHWRKLLLACYFLTVLVDHTDLLSSSTDLPERLWKTCFRILENEYGQPLQRVTLGLFGRLVMMIGSSHDRSLLRDQMVSKSFCEIFGKALVYDHREDSSVGGGHDAQWSAGVADLIRDSARNIAPRSLFPFQRTNQSSGTFKVSHAQLVENIMLGLEEADAVVASDHLLAFAKEMVAAPPSEDQRNQQCTSAEIFAGIARAFMQMQSLQKDIESYWETLLLPYLDEAIAKIPISLSNSYFDAIRFSIQFSSPKTFLPLTSWIFQKIESTLWQPKVGSDKEDAVSVDGTTGTDGFTAQSKWLYLCSAVLVELDETEIDGTMSRIPWYTNQLAIEAGNPETLQTAVDLQESWKLVRNQLLPRLAGALGHPYESCRDHISGCLFRICYCHRKMASGVASRAPSRSNSGEGFQEILPAIESQDPGIYVVQKLSALQNHSDLSFQVRYNALITARRFISYCIHFGEAKHEYTQYIVPLLTMAFEAIKSTVEEDNGSAEEATVAKRTLEAEVVKGYKYSLAEISVACVISYGGDKDISRVLDIVNSASQHATWQVRHASVNFLRCFQGSHKFVFADDHAEKITAIVVRLLGDDRREVSTAATAAVTGIIAALPLGTVSTLVDKYVSEANKSKMKSKKKGKKSTDDAPETLTEDEKSEKLEKEQRRARMQQSSVFFLCAAILAQPYETPKYVPKALAAISKHSFERNAPSFVRDTVKKCCAEYKRTHVSDNWELHRQVFTQEQLEALEDVVSSPHYYA